MRLRVLSGSREAPICTPLPIWHASGTLPAWVSPLQKSCSTMRGSIRSSPSRSRRWRTRARSFSASPDHVANQLLPALCIWQPWAWLIVNGYKDVENRLWCPPSHTTEILVHAGLNKSHCSEEQFEEIEANLGVRVPREFEHGGIIGVVEIKACAIWIHSPWHQSGLKAWMLTSPRRLSFRGCEGRQKLYRPEFD